MPVPQPVFAVIIPVLNKWELTRDCLESLARHTPEYPFEVLVADNASSDATVSELVPCGQALFGCAFTRLRSEDKRNFGPACNDAARLARAPLLFFLNNDTRLTPGWAPPLVRTFLPPESLDGLASSTGGKVPAQAGSIPGAVGPLLLYEDDTVQHLGVALAPSGFTHLYGRFPAAHPAVRSRRRLQAITAAALMIPGDLFRDCGGFYEEYRNGFEDVELCLRIRERGKTLSVVPDSVVYHLESRTPGRKDHDDHNAALLRSRCGSSFAVDLHQHGARDGFAVFVDDLLDISLRLTEKDEAAVSAAARGRTPADWLGLVREQPFWAGGREWLAAALEDKGALSDALYLRAEAAQQLPTVENYTRLVRLAARAGDSAVLEQAERRLNLMLEYRADKDMARRRARYILAQTAGRRDVFLESLYREKLRALHGE
ncbi:MAG: glycosyltransferase family 2 protein [Deltaproteobacteria bacterium]|jgi:GT2 family glycosyltransferase|nr:glycosyltransferase family 2 protein [Deltaproteobacteria bacterium]